MIGVNKPIRASMEMEKSMFTEEKTNAEVLIGAYYFTELIQKIKQMSLKLCFNEKVLVQCLMNALKQ